MNWITDWWHRDQNRDGQQRGLDDIQGAYHPAGRGPQASSARTPLDDERAQRNAVHDIYQNDRDQRNAMEDEAREHYGDPPRSRIEAAADHILKRPTAQQIQAGKRQMEQDTIDRLRGQIEPQHGVSSWRNSPPDQPTVIRRTDQPPEPHKPDISWRELPPDRHEQLTAPRLTPERPGISSWADLPPGTDENNIPGWRDQDLPPGVLRGGAKMEGEPMPQGPFRESTKFENFIDGLIYRIGGGDKKFSDKDMQEADRLNEQYAREETAKWQKEEKAMRNDQRDWGPDDPRRNAPDGGLEKWWKEQQPGPENDSTLNNSPENDRPRKEEEMDTGAPPDQPVDERTEEQRQTQGEAPAWRNGPGNRNTADDWPAEARDVIDRHAKRDSNEGWQGIDPGIRGNGATGAHDTRESEQHGHATDGDLEDLTHQTGRINKSDHMRNIFDFAGEQMPAPGVEPGRRKGRR